ncbi:MAG: stage II sporulation protein P [Oscillospiraceae bacterium]|jgi:stage II sporulation protein P|nr:stage II sporulation protein P [Oscillospiraceae bacterium]
MPNLNNKNKKKIKSALVKIAAGLAAVLVSPPLAAFVGDNSGVIVTLWEEEIAAHEERRNGSIISLEMSSSVLLLYKPTADGVEIIPQRLPPFDFNVGFNFFEEPAAQVLSRNISDVRVEPLDFTVIDGRIVKLNYAPNVGFINLDLAGQVRNETSLDRDFVLAESRKLPEIRLELNGEPEVLIMHTHTTEAFQPCGYDFFDASYYGRSPDSERNIVAVGAEMAKSFAEAGITVIHDGTVHDYPVFNGAYARSQQTVRQILEAYPSIKVVLDIHRDAIETGDGSRVAPVTQADGRDAAQVMIISAADDGTWDMPYFLHNFRLASLFQQQIEYDYPGITRAVLFQYSQYNQHLTPGSLLIEVGTHGNTLEEAKHTGRIIGQSMAEALLQLTVDSE